MVVTTTQHPPGVGPHAQGVPYGPQPVQAGPRHPIPGPFRGPHPDRQQQHNWPFFYMQPSQPYLPYQWPVPMPYVPYGNFPGLGYGMVVPPFPPASYMEAPGYILPHAQLHMVDYRRMMTPHLPPAMAYQARRFRCQNTMPSGRLMVSSEVQTEPVCVESSRRDCRVAPGSLQESGRDTGSGSGLSSPRPSEDKSSACAEDVMASNNVAGIASSDSSSAAPTSGILFQAEEVRIECSGTPAGLKIIHAKETTEVASSANGELLQCNMGSVHAAEDVVLRCYRSLSCGADEQREADLSHSDTQYLPPCHDLLMMAPCPSSATVAGLEGSFVTPDEPANSAEMHTLVVQRDPNLSKSEEDLCGTSKNVHFKILRLPFDLKCLDELRQMEASVWSIESLMPYVPSTEWLIQNGLLTPQKPSLATVMEVPAELPIDSKQTTGDAGPSPKENQIGTMIELDGQDSVTSLESLPPYLPSASWLADFNNVSYNKLASRQQMGNLSSWPEQQLREILEVDQDAKVSTSLDPSSVPVRFKDEKSKNRGRTDCHSPSIQEGCLDQSHSGLPVVVDHKGRICKSCLTKRRGSVMSSSPATKANGVKRCKVAPAHLVGDKVNLCTLCKRDPEKRPRCKASASSTHGFVNVGYETEGEVSENALYTSVGTKRSVEGQRLHCLPKLPFGRHSEKCPMSHQSKLREQNCSCDDPKGLRYSTSARDTNGCSRYSDTREKNDENLALSATERWRETEQRFNSQKQNEKSRKGSLQVSDTESTKSGGTMMTHKKHKPCAQTQELHRRDTRC
ncbi:uncharacterized protein LOC143488943 [Brachyhypopomus gauderio]|uniref:uncharacterized protein LOC143488943 n=1 Tax=Brachyhypopomus gauderio TaxID=698409 RepID=UPI0040410214